VRRYWSQAMMLLLGISLTVGFYEGRRLVKNTAKALTVATTITSSHKRPRHREDREPRDERGEDDLLEDDPELLGLMDEEDVRGKRRKLAAGSARAIMMDPDLSKAEKINLLRMRQRQKMLGKPGSPTALPGAIPDGPGAWGKPDLKDGEPVDTGLMQPERAPDMKLK
jgi:hypothetical protein